MGQFLDAAYRVLREQDRPLTSREITDIALQSGYLRTRGRTPWQTMKSKLSTDILHRGDASLFMRSEQAKFALRDWTKRVDEYVADRYQKALFDEDVIVFPAAVLSEYIPGTGLFPGALGTGGLSKHFQAMRRREAEEDPTVIQLVSVFVLRFNDLFLTYKRTKRLPESRLHDYYSLAFGGHLNPDDSPGLFNIFDPEQSFPWLERELREEVKLPPKSIRSLAYRGLLYDTSRPVSRQHLGIVYELILRDSAYSIGERGFLMDPKFESSREIQDRIDDFENWSILLLHELG